MINTGQDSKQASADVSAEKQPLELQIQRRCTALPIKEQEDNLLKREPSVSSSAEQRTRPRLATANTT